MGPEGGVGTHHPQPPPPHTHTWNLGYHGIRLPNEMLSCLTDVYFRVRISEDQTFSRSAVIVWGRIVDNVGGGYNATTGKFVAPLGGTYRFVLTVMNAISGWSVAMAFTVNGDSSCPAVGTGVGWSQTGVCSQVTRLEAGDAVWVFHPTWTHPGGYNGGYTFFEGFMIHAEV